jgi:hypothetical protein
MLCGCTLIDVDRQARDVLLRLDTTTGIDLTGDGRDDITFVITPWTGISLPSRSAGTSTGHVHLWIEQNRPEWCGVMKHTKSSRHLEKGVLIGDHWQWELEGDRASEWEWYFTPYELGERKEGQPWRLVAPDNEPFYVGLRLFRNDAQHYGWMRMSLERENEGNRVVLLIHDFAFALDPGESIVAGIHP